MKRLLEYVKENGKLREFLEENKDMLIKVGVTAVAVIAAFLFLRRAAAKRKRRM